MKLLGSRIRQRRRALHLHQADVVGPNSSSFLSKVENGSAYPSLKNLQEWSQKLQTTAGDLLGDHLILEAAKQSILLTKQCHRYLQFLPVTPLTIFLQDLSTCASSISSPLPDMPEDPELLYLYGQVLIQRGMLLEARDLSEEVLNRNLPTLWRFYHLSLVCQIYGELGENEKKGKTQGIIQSILKDLDHKTLLQFLPEPELICSHDLELLRISSVVQDLL